MFRARLNRRRSHHAPAALAVLAWAILALLSILPAGAAHAADPPATTNMTRVGTSPKGETALARIQRMVSRLNREAATPEGEAVVATRLAAQFRTTPEALRAEREGWGLGYGEVAMVYGFARASRKPGTTPEQVVTMRREGKSWETIAKDLGVKIDAVATRMKRQVGSKAAKPK